MSLLLIYNHEKIIELNSCWHNLHVYNNTVCMQVCRSTYIIPCVCVCVSMCVMPKKYCINIDITRKTRKCIRPFIYILVNFLYPL